MNIRQYTLSTLALCFLISIIYGRINQAKVQPAKVHSYSLNAIADKENVIPMVIIGSGPAGLSAALYGARANVKTVIIQGEKPGGLLTETSYVENWPGRRPTLGAKLIDDAREQAKSFGAILVDDSVKSVDFSTWPFVLYTENGEKIRALTVIIATGARPRMLGVAGEQEYWGCGVTSCAVCDAPFYKDQEVVVIGGGDSAVEEALQLATYAKKVTVLVRKDRMRAAQSMQDHLTRFGSVAVVYNVEVQRILGDGVQVTGVELLNNQTNERFVMPINGVFLAIGHDPSTDIFKKWVKTDGQGYIKLTSRTQESSMPGVFAAGDVADSRYRQAGVAAGDGIKSALDAKAFLDDIGFSTAVSSRVSHAVREEQKEIVSIPAIITNDDFKREVEKSDLPVVVDFFAHYCPPCMRMLPIFEAVAHEYVGKIKFVKVDTEIGVELVERFFVRKIPCLIVFKDGQLVARYNGAMNKDELTSFIEKFIS